MEPRSPEIEWPLVGRASELKHVATLLHAGRGAIVLAGAAGVGKTRPATECLGLAATRGFVPLEEGSVEAGRFLPGCVAGSR